MARIITTKSASGGSTSTSSGITLSDVRPILQWEYLGFDSTPSGIASYIPSFDRTTYIGYQYIMYGAGTTSTQTNVAVRLRVSGSDATTSGYNFSYQQPAQSGYQGGVAGTTYFYFPYSTFYTPASMHPMIQMSVFLRSSSSTDFEMRINPVSGNAYGAQLVWGSFYSTSEIVDGLRLTLGDSSSFLVGGGVYRFGLRRR